MKEERLRARLLCKAGSALLRRTFRQASRAGIVAALVPLGMIGLPGQAQAEVHRSSCVDGEVELQSGGQYLYEFTLRNNTTDDGDGSAYGVYILDWELPLIVGPGQTWSDLVTDIQSPTNSSNPDAVPKPWYYEVITPAGIIQASSDPDTPGVGEPSAYYGNASGPYGEYDWSWDKDDDPVYQDDNSVYGADPDRWVTPDYLIHWYTPGVGTSGEAPLNPVWPGNSREGFSFLSDYSGGNAPYMASWYDYPSTIGDPPSPQGGGPLPSLPGPSAPPGAVVPLPAAFPVAFIVMAGMAGVGYLRRRFPH